MAEKKIAPKAPEKVDSKTSTASKTAAARVSKVRRHAKKLGSR
jgi:hypothetical protein